MNTFNSDVFGRLRVAVALVNELAAGQLATRPTTVFQDYGHRAPHDDHEWTATLDLAADLTELLTLVTGPDTDAAVTSINASLRALPATPQIEPRPGRCQLHFHTPEADFADGWKAGVLAALALAYCSGDIGRLGRCQAARCERFFLDQGRNRHRRFCSLACQNRQKASSYRTRRHA